MQQHQGSKQKHSCANCSTKLKVRKGDSMGGFIKIHRRLMQSGVWQDPHYLKLWVYCLLRANYKEREQLIGNKMVKLNRGTFITGRLSLAEDMNKGMVREQQKNDLTWWRYLKNLEKWGMLNIKSNNKFSVVTIDKYDFYQSSNDDVEQLLEQQVNNKRTTDEQPLNTDKNLKNLKNLKKEKNIPYVDIISHLNDVAGTNFRHSTKKTQDLIKARYNEGFNLNDFKAVIDIKTEEWLNNQEMNRYLRPETLFGTKFESYLNQKKITVPTSRAIPDEYEHDPNAGEDW